MNWLYFLGGNTLGVILILYSKWITDSTSRIDFAESWFGATGTYTFWKVIGLGAMIFGFWALFNL